MKKRKTTVKNKVSKNKKDKHKPRKKKVVKGLDCIGMTLMD